MLENIVALDKYKVFFFQLTGIAEGSQCKLRREL